MWSGDPMVTQALSPVPAPLMNFLSGTQEGTHQGSCHPEKLGLGAGWAACRAWVCPGLGLLFAPHLWLLPVSPAPSSISLPNWGAGVEAEAWRCTLAVELDIPTLSKRCWEPAKKPLLWWVPLTSLHRPGWDPVGSTLGVWPERAAVHSRLREAGEVISQRLSFSPFWGVPDVF